MPCEFQGAVLKMIHQAIGGSCGPTPEWLKRPGRVECGKRWNLISAIYQELTDSDLPETTPPHEWRRVDCVLTVANSSPRIIEIDEIQHFNAFRASTLRRYSGKIQLAFDPKVWIKESEKKVRLEGGGFAAPKPPLFPNPGGRHLQRAFRDALCDILPPDHNFLPTLRIAKFEVADWLSGDHACDKMKELLRSKNVIA